MKTIYRSSISRNEIISLYDRQLGRLGFPWKDVYVETSFGSTHIVETGCQTGKPLLVFHGGNATTAYNLLACGFLLNVFHVFAVDTVGHPGKSAETCLPASGPAYGQWACEVISALGFSRMRCFGGSFGAGILVKAMCVSPETIERAALLVPSGIQNAPAAASLHMLGPMLAYRLTGKEKWLRRCIRPMSLTEDIDLDSLETIRCSLDNVKVKRGMPTNAPSDLLKKISAPVLVMAGEKDCLFPANRVLPQASASFPHCTTYLLQGRGHLSRLTPEEEYMIVGFLNEN